jgi:hypothetical protein
MMCRRSPLFQFVVGLVLALGVTGGQPFQLSAATADPPVCSQSTAGLIAEARSFVEVQCQVSQATFGASDAPSMTFKFQKPPSKPGEYDGLDAHGRAVTLTVAQSIEIPLRKLDPANFAEGDEGYTIVGYLKGNAGRIPVSMFSLKKPSLTGLPDTYITTATAVLTDAQVAASNHSERILAGARVVNPVTAASMPLSQVSGRMVFAGVASDLSTLYGEEVPPDDVGGGIDTDCVSQAYKRYAIAEQEAARVLGVCSVVAAGIFVHCMANFALVALATPLSIGALAIGAGVCLAKMMVALALCTTYYLIARDSALQTLMLDLQACGVHFAHM